MGGTLRLLPLFLPSEPLTGCLSLISDPKGLGLPELPGRGVAESKQPVCVLVGVVCRKQRLG